MSSMCSPFEEQLEICDEFHVDLEVKEVIIAFVTGSDKDIYGRKAREILEAIDDDEVFAQTFVDAKSMMLQVKSTNMILQSRYQQHDRQQQHPRQSNSSTTTTQCPARNPNDRKPGADNVGKNSTALMATTSQQQNQTKPTKTYPQLNF